VAKAASIQPISGGDDVAAVVPIARLRFVGDSMLPEASEPDGGERVVAVPFLALLQIVAERQHMLPSVADTAAVGAVAFGRDRRHPP
jgi:hypothetical protein